MNNKLKIILTVSLVVLIILATAGAFYWLNSKREIKESPSPTASDQTVVSPGILLDATEKEKIAVLGKTEEEVRADFAKEKDNCLNRFSENKPENLLEANRFQAIALASCQAVKADSIESCDSLKNDQAALNDCQKGTNIYLNSIYPVFEKKDCSISTFSANDRNMCNGLLLGNVEACQKVNGSLLEKATCLAVAQDSVVTCDQVGDEKEKEGCQDFYYFAKAIKNNDPSYLRSIKSGIEFVRASLFFNRNLSCTDILNPYNKQYCEGTFSEEILNRRISIWMELNKE